VQREPARAEGKPSSGEKVKVAGRPAAEQEPIGGRKKGVVVRNEEIEDGEILPSPTAQEGVGAGELGQVGPGGAVDVAAEAGGEPKGGGAAASGSGDGSVVQGSKGDGEKLEGKSSGKSGGTGRVEQQQQRSRPGQQQQEGRAKLEQLQFELPAGAVLVSNRPEGSPGGYKAVEGKSFSTLEGNYRDDLREAALLNMFLYCCWKKADDSAQRQEDLLLNAVLLKLLQLPSSLTPKGGSKEEVEAIKTLLHRRKGKVFVRCNKYGVPDAHGEYVRLVPGYLQGVLEHAFLRKRAQEVGEELIKELDEQLKRAKKRKEAPGIEHKVFSEAVKCLPGLMLYQDVSDYWVAGNSL
jgi:hypothetical protein